MENSIFFHTISGRTEIIKSTSITHLLRCKVILYNDNWHTFDEVIVQIIKAVGCSLAKAESITLKVHHDGKACIYTGELDKCLMISSVLEEIMLATRVEV